MLSKAKATAYVSTLACALSLVSTAAHSQATANGPYYAMPAWDQTLTTTRFVLLSNFSSQAVLDRETGLVWEKRASSFGGNQFLGRHFVAVEKCRKSKTGGRMGWRLPTLQEALTIFDATTGAFADPVFEFTGGFLWTSTDVAAIPGWTWLVQPGRGRGEFTPEVAGEKTDLASWLCVRSAAPGLPAQ